MLVNRCIPSKTSAGVSVEADRLSSKLDMQMQRVVAGAQCQRSAGEEGGLPTSPQPQGSQQCGSHAREGQLGARKECERPVFSKNALESTEYSCGQKTKLAKYNKALYCEAMCEKAKRYRKYYEKTPQCLGASRAFLNRRYTKNGNCKGTFTLARVYLVTLLRLRALLS